MSYSSFRSKHKNTKREKKMKKITAFLMMLAMVASFGVYAQEAAPAMEEAAPAMEEAAPAAPMEMEDDSWMPVVELSATWQSRLSSPRIL